MNVLFADNWKICRLPGKNPTGYVYRLRKACSLKKVCGHTASAAGTTEHVNGVVLLKLLDSLFKNIEWDIECSGDTHSGNLCFRAYIEQYVPLAAECVVSFLYGNGLWAE